ncbi:MAG TPA: hypothetical protein VFK05_27650 [Polyangiaceae bacterium]|nr:hypothetical protein [Polyangiaceae bacterium]
MASVLRNTRVTALTWISTIGLCLLGCAAAPAAAPSSANEAKADKHTKSAAPAQAEAAADHDSSQAGEASEPKAKPADDSRDGLRKASRPPLDLLTGNNVVYVFNFPGSAVGTTAKEQCESRSDNPAHARECVAKERSKIPVESVRFVKDGHGQYWWVTLNRYKGNLLKWHKIQFVPGKQDDDSVSLTLTGKDKGIAPMARVPASLKVELPNDYSIVISDPEYGEMMYDAKIGLLDPEQ